MRFDLLIKGGEVIDAEAGYRGKMDVAVKRNRIAAVEENIPDGSSFEVIDASGQYVTPGLIDIHAHLYKGVTYWGVDADAIGSQSGVTTWADAGSAGAVTLQGFRDYVIEHSKVKIFAFVNIASIGLVAQDYELTNPEYCNIALLKSVVKRHRDIVVGIKLRAGRSGGAQDLLPFKRARRTADELELPLMMHISTVPPDLEIVLSFLKPGDILTHCYTGQTMKMIDDDGKILPAAKKVWDGGVIMDLGHGCGSLSFDSAESLISQGYWPHIISTDLHTLSIHGANLIDPLKGAGERDITKNEDAVNIHYQVKGDGKPAFNLLTCMDKMLCLGMPFPEIIRATTSRPAEVLGMKGEIGTIKPGACADITGLVIDSGNYELVDIHGQIRHGKKHVCNTFTILNGRPFERIEAPAPPSWIELVEEV
jgi:dihydroorotase